MNRRFDKAPDKGRYYPIRPGAYVIIDTGDGLLASFQESPVPEFQLPGGGIDLGEQPLAALHREVREETGYGIHSVRRLGMFHRHTFMPDYDRFAHKQCHVYAARLGRRLSAPTEPGHSAVFLPWDVALEKLAVSGDRHFVAHYLGRGIRALPRVVR